MIQLKPEDWRLISDVFHEVVESSPDKKFDLLEARLGDRPSLKLEVMGLLTAHEAAGEFLEAPVHSDTVLKSLTEAPPVKKFEAGERLGEFMILRELGRGSFATVYLAHQVSLGREVAIKVSPNFGQEALMMAPLEHDHIVKVFSESVEEAKDLRILCMQYVPGITLEVIFDSLPQGRQLDGKTLLGLIDASQPEALPLNPTAMKDREHLSLADPVDTALWMGYRLADALGYAHEKKVLHLDVKPGNILLNPYGRPLLTDFNVAAKGKGEEGAEILGGTLKYMAPEHLLAFRSYGKETIHRSVDNRADIFSLGVLMREMLSKSPGLVTPPDLDRILERCTDRTVTARYASARDLARALGSVIERREIAQAMPKPGRLMKFTMEHPYMALITFILVPQFVGSAINISYNFLMIVSALSVEQQSLFDKLVVIYNPLLYVPGFYFIDQAVKPIRRFLNDPQKALTGDPKNMDRLRHHVLGVPSYVAKVSMAAWMMGFVLFPTTIAVMKTLSPGIFFHFFISFLLSALIATTYSFLYTQFLVLEVIYPRIFPEGTAVRQTARRELKPFENQANLFQYNAGFVPIVGAMLILASSSLTFSPSGAVLFRSLMMSFLTLGMVGTLLAIRITKIMQQTLNALRL